MMIIKDMKNLQLIRNQNKNKKIGLCHGVFDILHYGHIEHFNEAKKNCDILIVSVTSDKFVNKGPNQPYNSENKRAAIIRSLNMIDHVYINNALTSIELIKNLKPNFYFKGKDYLEKDITNNLNKEIQELKRVKGKFIITKTLLMSSTHIMNKSLVKWNKEQIKVLNKIKRKSSFKDILKIFENVSKQQITIVGEPIIDKYTYCEVSGKATKDPTLSLVKKKSYSYSGGVISIAQILSKFYKKVNLITFGRKNFFKRVFSKYPNVNIKSISNKQIQEKERFIDEGRLQRLVQIANYKNIQMNSKEKTHQKIINHINALNSENIIIADFGIGLFSDNIVSSLSKLKKKLYINVQTNSLNIGLNLFTKYKRYKYMSLDLKEWQIGFQLQNLDEQIIEKKVSKLKGQKSITLGNNGSIYLDRKKKYYSPVFTKNVVDTTGCGDAYFAITSILISQNKVSKELIPFLGNIYAGMHSQYLGNSHITEKSTYLKYINSLTKV